MYTLPQFSFFPSNYDDDDLSAGGIGSTKKGLHGICGDRYSAATPRPHETGGKYGLFPKYGAKAIGGCYAPGAIMDIKYQITANHKGYFEFGLCKLNGKNDAETEACFQTLSQPDGQKQWFLPAGNKIFSLQYQLPSGVTCDGDSHCVLRSWWVGGNNADVGMDGQEQFWNCADIYISNNCGATPPSPSSGPPTQSPSTTTKPNATNTVKPAITTIAPQPTYAPSPSTAKPTSSVPQPTHATTTPPSKPTSRPTISNPKTTQPSYPTQPLATTSPTDPTQVPGQCGSCANCYYASTNACFIGFFASQCAMQPLFKWCGPSNV
ncbi:hypothetical protein AaE_008590 [Aphanomyces astaci]|uniref:Chitin-binding type-4 domain-containing protein n=1 Tax=Aphanomyces astaci TaxID=112090 RepID=A0A6A5AEL6_APHAT|nr:hypothetical protein AaE_008590 [Aphanomyces astaci]